jgi:hypothetical protein
MTIYVAVQGFEAQKYVMYVYSIQHKGNLCNYYIKMARDKHEGGWDN